VVMADAISGGVHYHHRPHRKVRLKLSRRVICLAVALAIGLVGGAWQIGWWSDNTRFDQLPDMCSFIRGNNVVGQWLPAGQEMTSHPSRPTEMQSCGWDDSTDKISLSADIYLASSRLALAARFASLKAYGTRGASSCAADSGFGDETISCQPVLNKPGVDRPYYDKERDVLFRWCNLFVEVEFFATSASPQHPSPDQTAHEVAAVLDRWLRTN
jgi:hypothetical protein